jgi:hypothetical protein
VFIGPSERDVLGMASRRTERDLHLCLARGARRGRGLDELHLLRLAELNGRQIEGDSSMASVVVPMSVPAMVAPVARLEVLDRGLPELGRAVPGEGSSGGLGRAWQASPLQAIGWPGLAFSVLSAESLRTMAKAATLLDRALKLSKGQFYER